MNAKLEELEGFEVALREFAYILYWCNRIAGVISRVAQTLSRMKLTPSEGLEASTSSQGGGIDFAEVTCASFPLVLIYLSWRLSYLEKNDK